MADRTDSRGSWMIWTGYALIVIFAVLISAGPIFAHSGKKHANSFTALRALQKATELYYQLIVERKLFDSWETDLEKADISIRQKEDHKEYVVSFQRSGIGDPNTVYIFFTAGGKYAGSNFTGE